MSRKTVSFGQVIAYIDQVKAASPPIFHNLLGKDSAAIQAEFQRNAQFLSPRKNGNVLYHEVLSFGDGDSDRLTPAIIDDLTRKYLERRAPHALAYGRAHFDTDCPHVHLLISANNFEDTRRLRLSRKQFRKVQQEVETYQQERYPFLEHSLAQKPRAVAAEKRRDKGEPKPPNAKSRSRGFATPRKDMVRDLVSSTLQASFSGADCYQRLLSLGLKLYKRGKSIGVEEIGNGPCPAPNGAGRRYRLNTLGLAELFDRAFDSWRKLPTRQRQMDQLTRKKTRRQERDRGR